MLSALSHHENMISYCVGLHTPNRWLVSPVPRSPQLFVRWFLLSYKREQSNWIWQVVSWRVQESQFPSGACFLNLHCFVVPQFQRRILESQKNKTTYLLLSCCTYHSYGTVIGISIKSFFWEHLTSLVNSLSRWDRHTVGLLLHIFGYISLWRSILCLSLTL